MTVKELIEKLSQLDPELHVFTHGYEDGYNDVTDLREEIIALNYHKDWYYGKHQAIKFIRKDKLNYKTVRGVIL